jgi:hypothetical protein
MIENNKNLLVLFKAHSIDSKIDYHNNLYSNLIEKHIKNLKGQKNSKIYFLMANLDIKENSEIQNEFIFYKIQDNYWDALLKKIINGMNFFLSHNEYSHLFTTNLSTCINIPRILELCDNTSVKAVKGFNEFCFPSGAGSLYNRQTVKKIIEYFNDNNVNYDKINKKIATDDLFIGKILNDLNIKITDLDRVDLLHLNSNNIERINKKTSHVRIKYDKSRDLEIKDHEKVYNIFYN